MASDLPIQSPVDPEQIPDTAALLRAQALLQTDPKKAAALNKAADNIQAAEDKIDKVNLTLAALTQDPDSKEQSNPDPKGDPNDLNSAGLKTAMEGMAARQDLSTETLKEAQGIGTDLIGLILPIFAAVQGTWQFVEGLGKFLDSTTKAAAALGASSAQQAYLDAINLAIQAAGKDPKELKDPAKFKALANTILVPPVAGVSNSVMSLGDTLDRFQPTQPFVATPQAKDLVIPKSSTTTSPNGVTRTTEITATPPSPLQVLAAAGVVTHDLEKPPTCDFVNTNQFQADPNPYKTFGNPIAAIQNQLKLASDVSNLAGQQKALAEGLGKLSGAATALSEDNAQRSLYLSIRAILADLVTFNFQNDQQGDIATTTNRSILWWNNLTPQSPVISDLVFNKLNSATPLDNVDETEINTAISNLQTEAASAIDPQRSWGAMPGNLIWAALGNNLFSGTLDELIDQIPLLTAIRENVPLVNRNLIQDIIFNFEEENLDDSVSDIPILMMTSDSRLALYSPAVSRWIETLNYLKNLTTAEVNALRPFETQISTSSLLFIDLVKTTNLNYTKLYTDLLKHELTYTQKQALDLLALEWDNITAAIVPPINPITIPELFLAELLAAKSLLPGSDPMTQAITEIQGAALTIGGPIGTDLAQMIGVVGTLIRTSFVLNDIYITIADEKIRDERLKKLLTKADEMSAEVEHFPNAGMLGRIAEAI